MLHNDGSAWCMTACSMAGTLLLISPTATSGWGEAMLPRVEHQLLQAVLLQKAQRP